MKKRDKKKSNEIRVKCEFCGKDLKGEELGGVFNSGEGTKFFCSNITCLMNFNKMYETK